MSLRNYIKQHGDRYILTVPINATLQTSGDGYWSNVAKYVKVKHATIDVARDPQEDDNEYFDDSDLRVYFDRRTWKCSIHGLIYTDKLFMSHLRTMLHKAGVPLSIANEVSYSEQGMQDEEYVSCDAYELANAVREAML